MRCPFCNHDESKVTDSRNATETNAVRRRRECLSCLKRFTTFEMVDLTIQVHKRDGRFEDFQQDKLIRGLDAACRHTRISHEQARALANKITADLMERQVREISTTELGEIVMQHLEQMDTIAYIRFACVYRRFKDVNDLMDALQTVTPKDGAQLPEKILTETREDEHVTQESRNSQV
jgi:transcriptional repressor NrdR